MDNLRHHYYNSHSQRTGYPLSRHGHSLLPKDERNNAVVGENVRMYECNNCIVHTPHLKQAVIQGLDGYIIAEKEGTLLICRLAEEQRIKEFSKA